MPHGWTRKRQITGVPLHVVREYPEHRLRVLLRLIEHSPDDFPWRGKGSGATVENPFWQVWTAREGRVIRATHHAEKAQALEAAGLSE